MTKLAIVTATLDFVRAQDCVQSWWLHAAKEQSIPTYIVLQSADPHNCWMQQPGERNYFYATDQILGTVPAFAIGVQQALEDGADIIACLHDDLEMLESGWDEMVVSLFKACPRAGLCGFGGGKGLGSDDIYKTPYHPMQLARQRFLSNMRDAEAHGERCEIAIPVACLDGFSQIGRREFWQGRFQNELGTRTNLGTNLFETMRRMGVIHHFYDGMLGCFAKRLGWQTWMLPVSCHHYGGRTAVGDARYAAWADQQRPDSMHTSGDQMFWRKAHRIGYEEFHDVLPIRT